MTEKLKIIERYNEHAALIKLGHSYTCPSKATKRQLLDLLKGYSDDELLNISQIDGVPGLRPLLIKSASEPEPEWKCLCPVESS
jgi:hypothetical protein